MKKVNTLERAVKKEIKKLVNLRGAHFGTVNAGLAVQFPSVNPDDYAQFIELEFNKKWAKIDAGVPAGRILKLANR